MIEIEKEKAYEEGCRDTIASFKYQFVLFPQDIKEALDKIADEMLTSLHEFQRKKRRKL